MRLETRLTREAGIRVPLICGAMYPCSNPELVGAVSAAGGLGVIQPVSLTYVYGHAFREGLRLAQRLAGGRPIGMNALIEASSRRYHERMVRWVETALEEGIRFFVTSLGNPGWVVRRAHAAGAVVYHDVTERKWAVKGRDEGVDGLVAVNRRAGGHPGPKSAEALLAELADLGLPVVCAGGVGDASGFVAALRLGYAGVQAGTRFIATTECAASGAYKEAIVAADEDDVVWTERLTGLPVAVLRTPWVERLGTRVHPVGRWLLRNHSTRRWARTLLALRALPALRGSVAAASDTEGYWQAGKSVARIVDIAPAGEIVADFEAAARTA